MLDEPTCKESSSSNKTIYTQNLTGDIIKSRHT
nr:MAG TPA: hypothetical protein [Caudoviricetes sp.]